MDKQLGRLEGFAQYAKEVAAEGAVLLKNENQSLPIKLNERVAVFGRIQNSYYKSGTGSGGLVNVDYVVNILDGLRNSKVAIVDEKLADIYQQWVNEHPFEKGAGWGQEPWSQVEMEVSDEIVSKAASENDVAIVIIGRTAGEDQDARNEPGSYLLTELEEKLIEQVSNHFPRCAVVLNVGNIIDMKWVEKYQVPSVMYVWQGGMEGGNAVADVLTGKVNPCGKLSNTISIDLDDVFSTRNFGRKDFNIYQEDIYVGYRYFETFAQDRVLYPFGFGLSYSTFTMEAVSTQFDGSHVYIDVSITNTGTVAGKEVVQLYFGAPMGVLGKPLKSLIAYKKTKLIEPNQSEILSFTIDIKEMASYDDSGATGNPFCYVLEAGEYLIHMGNSVRHTKEILRVELKDLIAVEKLESAMAPITPFQRIKPVVEDGNITIGYEDAPLRTYDLNQRIADRRPVNLAYTGDQGYKLTDVAQNKVTLDEFIAQFSDEDLACIVRGEGMSSPKATPGTAAVFGGVTDSLLNFGLPIACCADGPSGIRMDSGAIATSLPNGTCLACTWNTEMVEELFQMEGRELIKNNIDFLLGPGINIHRNPLNGRNFEYFSEDPYLTGSMAVAQSKGMHSEGASGTLKHFTANNQETARHDIDCIISERALREIYLKGYEMAVKQANARSIMTSYSAVNGIWAASNFDLNTTILREQWGFDGFVMTDWWAKLNDEGKPATIRNTKAMVRAQNDIYMVVENAQKNSTNDNTIESLASSLLMRGELQRSAKNICNVLLQSEAFRRLLRGEQVLTQTSSAFNQTQSHLIKIDEDTEIFLDGVDTSAGNEKSLELDVINGGEYTLAFTLVSNLNPLAQLPINVLINDQFSATFVFNGTDGQFTTREKQLNLETGAQKLTFAFPQSGLKIQRLRFIKR
ncbi:MAG: beta-glucosidase [Firmicutes bacterium HGW-Firmicutes-20]|jgi:beta-glucosidase|nr:MAG: beta-glucosidase [Firmicutes bacterium HGW-Firmicutes-20]PKM89697.1 MAG: beta-glucosidase [Firmicutes bacterium HGW-Firmicutes-10]